MRSQSDLWIKRFDIIREINQGLICMTQKEQRNGGFFIPGEECDENKPIPAKTTEEYNNLIKCSKQFDERIA